MASLLKYFDLGILPARLELGPDDNGDKERKSRRTIWTTSLYFSVFGGVISSYLIDPGNIAQPLREGFGLGQILVSFIVAGVIFPPVYKLAEFNVRPPRFMQLFVAFQYGFFWPVIYRALVDGKLFVSA